MLGAMPQGRSYGSAHISGKARAILGDTYVVNNYYLCSGLSELADHVDPEVTELPQHLGRDTSLTNKAANDSYAAPSDATGDISTRLDPESGPVAVVEAVASVLRTADMCNKIARRLNDLKHDASLDSVACRIRLVSITIEFLWPSLRCIPSNKDKDGILKECLADIESLLVRITKGLETWTDSGSTNLVKTVLHLGQTRTARQRLRALEMELDKQQNTLSTHVSTRLPGRWGHHETGTAPLPPRTRVSPITSASPRSKHSRRPPCEQGLCPCLCHIPLRRPRGFIVAAPAYPLHRCSCHRREVWVSIAVVQKILSARLALEWNHGLTLD